MGTGLGNAQRLQALRRRFRDAGVPVSGSVELTRRCNLRCVHCYLGNERTAPRPSGELDARAWLHLVDRMGAAGCLDLLITGGEPLLRPDFAAVYSRARRAGMRITIFTNATLVDEEVIALLRDLPPAMVEVSIYGATEQTHDRITGLPGSLRQCLTGVERLARAGLTLTVKTVLMTLNLSEFDAMAQLAADRGARWRFDPAIFPRLDGDRSPLAFRIPPAEAARREIPNRERAIVWRDCHEAGAGHPPSPRLYTCGAGLTDFHVDPRGTLLPCLVSSRPSRDLQAQDFSEAWREISAEVAGLTVGAAYRCNACDKRNICSLCPPFHELECGSYDVPSGYLCELGDKRRERMYHFVRE